MTTVRACANIALVKYWGKRDAAHNLPAAGSLSLTLAGLVTETTVELDPALAADTVELDGKPADASRVTPFLDLVRARANIATRARVISANKFPTASGLASSASGFAALALAATKAAGLEVTPRELAVLARIGSGSAARSIFPGFVRMYAGARAGDGPSGWARSRRATTLGGHAPAAPSAIEAPAAAATTPTWYAGDDAYAVPLESSLVERVRMVIAVVGGGAPKSHGSRDAMEHCAATSPLYDAWVRQVPRDLAAAEQALAAGDLAALGQLAEANALAMHATALAARPAIVYWQPATLALLAEVRALRARSVPAWATIDAGPHVKVLTDVDHADAVAAALRPHASEVIVSAPGPGAEVIA